MTDPISTIAIALACIISIVGTVMTLRHMMVGQSGYAKFERLAVAAIGLLCAGTFIWRAAAYHGSWNILASHFDGLVVLIALSALAMILLQLTGQLRGLHGFAMPLLSVLLLWALCASWWTYELFVIRSAWSVLHLVSVYGSGVTVLIGAAASVMYLFIRRQLKTHDHLNARLSSIGSIATLERSEKAIVSAATLSVILLGGAAISGVVIIERNETAMLDNAIMGQGKIVIATGVWIMYMLIALTRYITALRGRPAAWMSLIAWAGVMAVAAMSLGLVNAIPEV